MQNSFNQQSETPQDSLAPEKPNSSDETQSSVEPRQGSLPSEERTDGDYSVTEESATDSDSGLASESSDKIDSELVSSVPETPLQKLVSSTSQENLPGTQKAQVNRRPIHPLWGTKIKGTLLQI